MPKAHEVIDTSVTLYGRVHFMWARGGPMELRLDTR